MKFELKYEIIYSAIRFKQIAVNRKRRSLLKEKVASKTKAMAKGKDPSGKKVMAK